MSRLRPAGKNWVNPGRDKESVVYGEEYDECAPESGKTLALSRKLVGPYQPMYLCKMDKVKTSIDSQQLHND